MSIADEKAKRSAFTGQQASAFNAWVDSQRLERCGHGNAKASCPLCARNKRRAAEKKLRRKM